MPDAPPDPAPAPDSGVPPKKIKRSPLNKAQIAALQKAEQVGLAAQKTGYATPLATRAITAEIVTAFMAAIAAARTQAAQSVQSTNAKAGATQAEGLAEMDLVHALQEVQAAARQKHFASSPNTLGDYYIGQKLNETRALLQQYYEGILDQLATDTLPGITPAKITALSDLWAAIAEADEAQADAQGDATTGRGTLEDQVKAITTTRMTIQFAADAEWPYHQKTSVTPRRDFQLPAGTPFTG